MDFSFSTLSYSDGTLPTPAASPAREPHPRRGACDRRLTAHAHHASACPCHGQEGRCSLPSGSCDRSSLAADGDPMRDHSSPRDGSARDGSALESL